MFFSQSNLFPDGTKPFPTIRQSCHQPKKLIDLALIEFHFSFHLEDVMSKLVFRIPLSSHRIRKVKAKNCGSKSLPRLPHSNFFK